MEEYIIIRFNNNHLKYIKIENETSLIKIYNLFKNKFPKEPVTDIEYFYYGCYYNIFEKKF